MNIINFNSTNINELKNNKNTIVTWKLEQLDKDKTKLTLIHSGFTNADRLQYDDHNKGWSWHIKRLENLTVSKT